MNTLEPMSDDDLERVVRAIYRREEAPISSFEESWAALEEALTARQTVMSAPTEAQAPADIHETSSDSPGGSDNTPRDIPQRGLQQARRFVVVAGPLAAVLLVSLLAAVIFNAIAHRGAGTGPTLVNQLIWRQVHYPDGVNSAPSGSGPWTLNLQRQYRLSVRDKHSKRRTGLTAPLDHARSRRDLDATRRYT